MSDICPSTKTLSSEKTFPFNLLLILINWYSGKLEEIQFYIYAILAGP